VDRLCFSRAPVGQSRLRSRRRASAVSELQALSALAACGFADVAIENLGGVPYVSFDATVDRDALAVLSNLSSLYAAFRLYGRGDDAHLVPLPLARLDRWDTDLTLRDGASTSM